MTEIPGTTPSPLVTRAIDPASKAETKDPDLWVAAQKLESAFLSEMLKSAGFGAPRSTFGGGAGEEQFASFLRTAHADEMTAAGGIGLAESLYRAMAPEGDHV